MPAATRHEEPTLKRLLIAGLVLLHLGPGLAFAGLAFGCEGVRPWLGSHCEAGALRIFAVLTLLVWALLSAAALSFLSVRHALSGTPAGGPSPGRRWLALCALSATGLLAGGAVRWLLGSDLGFLALPALLAAGWLALANPACCVPDEGDAARRGGR